MHTVVRFTDTVLLELHAYNLSCPRKCVHIVPLPQVSCDLCFCRLQQLERSQTDIASELGCIKAMGSSIKGWKQQMDDAGTQAATALELVQSNGKDIR